MARRGIGRGLGGLLGGASVLALLAMAAAPAAAGEAAGCDLAESLRRAVVEVVDGDTLLLDDRSELRLVGALRPANPLPAGGAGGWPPEAETARALAGLVRGRSIALAFGGRASDRYGRRLAQAFLIGEDGSRTWLQGELVSRGLARAYSFRDNRACMAGLLAREAEARSARRGLWASAAYAVRPAGRAHELLRFRQTFALVEGEVLKVEDRKRRLYLNFGADWREDFTIVVEGRDRAAFAEAGLDLMTLRGRRVRVRGWLETGGGPLIRADHPEQIEVLGPAPAPPAP